jgi:phage gpG-like protein
MGGTSVSVTVNPGGVLTALSNLLTAGKQLRAPLNAIGQDVAESIQLCFVDGQSPYGAPWVPLRSRAGQPLINTGKLRASITHQATDADVTIGTNANAAGVPYPRVHQFGAVIEAKNAPYLRFKTAGGWVRKKRVEIPARPFMPLEGLPDDWAESVLDILTEHFEGAFA